MRCEEVREVLPAYSRDGDVGLPVRRHLSRCEECSRELGQYQAIATSLTNLSSVSIEPPAGLFHQLASVPYRTSRADEVRGHLKRNRNAYAAGVAVAAAGALGAALWRSRRARTVTA